MAMLADRRVKAEHQAKSNCGFEKPVLAIPLAGGFTLVAWKLPELFLGLEAFCSFVQISLCSMSPG